jgi:hypothetical protein
MHLIQNVKQKSMARNAMIPVTAITLTTAVATDALATGRSDGGVGHVGGFGAGHIGGFRAEPRETPVSPASPGSIFDNG